MGSQNPGTHHVPHKTAEVGNKRPAESTTCRRLLARQCELHSARIAAQWRAASSLFPPTVARGCAQLRPAPRKHLTVAAQPSGGTSGPVQRQPRPSTGAAAPAIIGGGGRRFLAIVTESLTRRAGWAKGPAVLHASCRRRRRTTRPRPPHSAPRPAPPRSSARARRRPLTCAAWHAASAPACATHRLSRVAAHS